MIFVFILVAVLIGSLMPIQAGINAEFTRFLKHPYLVPIISLIVGSIGLSFLLLLQGVSMGDIKRLGEAPPYMFLGGILSAIFVTAAMFFIPKMGATTMIASYVTGQLLMSVVIDHYGLMNLTPQPVSATRILGVILLFAGLFLVVKKNT
jgi:transporter family-2 protein